MRFVHESVFLNIYLEGETSPFLVAVYCANVNDGDKPLPLSSPDSVFKRNDPFSAGFFLRLQAFIHCVAKDATDASKEMQATLSS